jgi:tRNA threonylcarbamoyladenosine biosynthesis protein TsaB
MRGGEVLYEGLLGPAPGGGPRHSTALLSEVEQAVAAGGGWEQIGRLAVGRGPGSFVGIRIGLATARGLAAGTSLPVTGVCTLDALGLALAASAGRDRLCLALIDARRGEVFAALYGPGGGRAWEPAVLSPSALLERLAGLPTAPLAGGSGAIRFRSELARREIDVPDDADPVHRIAARHICALAEAAMNPAGEALDPIYLRPPDAQRWRERDTSQRAE